MDDEEDRDSGFVGETPWPNISRPCFAGGPERRLDAEVEWVQSQRNLYPYIEGFQRAAAMIVDSLKAEHQNPNYIVWPLASLWRHCIELRLKQVIVKGKELKGERGGFPPHHRLTELWNLARPYIVECGAKDAPELDNVEVNLIEFEKIDPNAAGFRYPFATDGVAPSLQSPPTLVNLLVLHETMGAIANFLDGVLSVIQEGFDYACSAEADFHYDPGH